MQGSTRYCEKMLKTPEHTANQSEINVQKFGIKRTIKLHVLYSEKMLNAPEPENALKYIPHAMHVYL